jgi:hypothetical protein
VRQARYLPQCSSLHTTPHARRLAKLTTEEQYDALELFRGDLLRHDLVAHLPDRAQEQVVSFSGRDWQAYIPFRLPDIHVSKKRLPGKADILLNPANEDPELALPVDELELKIFNAIDSRRPIAEIISLVASEQGQKSEAIHNRSRLLFEQLWWYDLVGGFILPFESGPEKGTTQ